MPLPLVPIITALVAGGSLVPHAAGGMIVTSAGGYVAGTYLSTATITALLAGGATALGTGAAVFAASVAVQVITELMSCNQSEQTLAMHRGAKLTHYVKTECSEKIPLIGCVEWKQYYCSYNSVLARLVNIQGKAQLGKSVEGCSGFTVEEIGKLDFDKFNLSEFVNEMTQKAVSNLPKDIKGNYTPMMQSTSQGSSQGKSYQLPSYLNQ